MEYQQVCSSGSSNSEQTCVINNIISNHDFSLGLQYWQPNCRDGQVVSLSTDSRIAAKTGTNIAIISKRTKPWHGLEQIITGKVSPGSTYSVTAWVSYSGRSKEAEEVVATLKLVDTTNSPTACISCIGRTCVFKEQWEKLEGTFSLEKLPDRLIICLEGPSPCLELLVDSLVVSSPITPRANLEEDCAMVIIGQMRIATRQVELYRQLIGQFGEIVSPNLRKSMVDIFNMVLEKLLNAVGDMIDITPETISEELILDWEEMAESSSRLGLKIDWFVDRVKHCRKWLDNHSEQIILLTGQISAKQEEMELKRKELQLLESELHGLRMDLETAQRSQFDFAFFNDK